jgi:hypothetical protein
MKKPRDIEAGFLFPLVGVEPTRHAFAVELNRAGAKNADAKPCGCRH